MQHIPKNGSRAVRLAATDLRQALALPEPQRESRVREAKKWLLSAAEDQGRESAAATEQYFSAPPSTGETTVSAADALAGIMADAQVGNTLIAAGHALNETGSGANPAVLDDAILALESTPDFADQIATALNFAGTPTHSADLDGAAQTFQSRIDESLKTIVKEAHDTGGKVVDQLLKVDGTKALEALAQLGGPLAKLPDFGVFIKRGIEKLRQAMDSLMRLLDNEALRQVKENLTAFWNHLTDGALVDSLLAWAFDKHAIDGAVTKAVGLKSLKVEAFDSASDLLPPLGEGFKSKMTWANALTGVVAAGVGLLLFTGVVAAGPLAIFTAGAYLLILAAVVIIGRDYAGKKGLFHEGKGILGVAESLAA